MCGTCRPGNKRNQAALELNGNTIRVCAVHFVVLCMPFGTLFLLPVPLSDTAASASYTPFFVETINAIQEYIVENEKTARKFLKQAGLTRPQQELILHDYGKHARQRIDAAVFFAGLEAGRDVGLMSEAGAPGVADPGAEIVAEAHRRGIRVVPLVGPSSLLLALMASGFSGQSFVFHGYLPIPKDERSKRIKQVEKEAALKQQTQLFIETPFRNNQLLDELLRTCASQTRLCVACNLTAPDEFVRTRTVSEWKTNKPDLHKKPTVFLLG